MFQIGDLVTFKNSKEKSIGYITNVVDNSLVWVMFFEANDDKPLLYRNHILVKYV